MSTSTPTLDPFDARDTFETDRGPVGIYRLSRLEESGCGAITTLPYSIRVLLEAVLRGCDGTRITAADVRKLAG